MCTPEKLYCVKDLRVDNAKCLPECSGMLVTSYTEKEIENHELPRLVTMMSKYFSEKLSLNDMEQSLKKGMYRLLLAIIDVYIL